MPVAEHRFVALEPAETEHEGYEGHEATASMRHHDHAHLNVERVLPNSRRTLESLEPSIGSCKLLSTFLAFSRKAIHRFW